MKTIRTLLIICSIFFVFVQNILAEREIVSKRGFYSKSYEISPGIYRMDVSLIPIHYLDENGSFTEIPESALTETLYGEIREQFLALYGLSSFDDSGTQTLYGMSSTDDYNPEGTITFISNDGTSCEFPTGGSSVVINETPDSFNVDYRFFETWNVEMSVFEPWYDVLEINHSTSIISFSHPSSGQYLNDEYTTYIRDYEYPQTFEYCDYFTNCAIGEVFDQFTVTYNWYNYTPPPNPWTFTAGQGHTLTSKLQQDIENSEPVHKIRLGYSIGNVIYDNYDAFDVYFDNAPSLSITYSTTIDITLSNKDLNSPFNDLDGTLSLDNLTTGGIDYDHVPSGSIVEVEPQEMYSVQTNQSQLQGKKHIRWNDRPVDYLLKKVNFEMPQDETELTAYFTDQSTVTIDAQPDVPLELHDPWYVSDENTLEQPDDFLPISQGEYQVFLDQSYSIPGNPYYSLRVPQYAGAFDGIYEFNNWSSSSASFGNSAARETYVVFNAPGTIQANYTKISNQPGNLVLLEPISVPPDAYIEFHPDFKITINYLGELNALGTDQSPITFTSDGTGNWPGIKVFNDGTINLQHVTISNSTNGITFAYDDNVTINAKDKTIDNVTFTNNVSGLLVKGGVAPPLSGTSSITLTNCNFTQNDTGIVLRDARLPGTFIIPEVDVAISHSTFNDNWFGIYVEENVSYLSVNDNSLEGNFQAIVINNFYPSEIQYYSAAYVHHNMFAYNIWDGVFISDMGPGSDVLIFNNTFYGNRFSVFRFSDAEIGQCWVYNNIATNGDNGFYLSYLDDVHYNDVWDITSGFWPPGGGQGNINEDPQFSDTLNGDFTLLSTSPCIDAGDPTSPLDPDNTVADMGAYYYDAVPSAPVLSISGTMGDYPTLSWVDGGESDLDHFVLKKTYTNDSGTMTSYINISAGTNQYMDTGIIIQRRGNTIAKYRVKSVDWIDQESPYSNQRSTFGLGPMWKEAIPESYALPGNYPNPFNPTTTLRYDLPEQSHVQLVIYDILGREVRTLLDSREVAGFKSVIWDGTDDTGISVSTGIYIYMLRAWSQESEKTYQKTRKMVLLR